MINKEDIISLNKALLALTVLILLFIPIYDNYSIVNFLPKLFTISSSYNIYIKVTYFLINIIILGLIQVEYLDKPNLIKTSTLIITLLILIVSANMYFQYNKIVFNLSNYICIVLLIMMLFNNLIIYCLKELEQ